MHVCTSIDIKKIKKHDVDDKEFFNKEIFVCIQKCKKRKINKVVETERKLKKNY